MFHGSIVALVTPMDEHGKIDYVSLQKLLEIHQHAGTDGVVVAGTTGESATLSENDYRRLLSNVIGQVGGDIHVIAGTGSADTARAIERTRLAADMGADGALIVTPYYNRPMQSGLLAHYHALADTSRIPLVLYNVPTRTAVDMSPDTVAALSKRDEIVAIKEAVADMDRIRLLTELCGASFTVLSGDDQSCCEAMRNGARGVVSVAANVVPRQFHDMCEMMRNNNWAAAVEIDNSLRHLYELLAVETNPIPVKWALHRMALIGQGIRLPLLPLDKKYHEKVTLGLERMGLV